MMSWQPIPSMNCRGVMRRKLWLLATSVVTLLSLSTPQARAAEEGTGGGGTCKLGGGHVLPQYCQIGCCSGECNACAADGHYVCAPL
jgi:hypothetical protein